MIRSKHKLYKKETSKLRKYIYMSLIYIVVGFIFILLIRTLIIFPIKMNNTMMLPNIKEGDITYFINKNFKTIQRFQVVLVKWKSTHLVTSCRIIGLSNENIIYASNTNSIYINKNKIKEPYKTLFNTNQLTKSLNNQYHLEEDLLKEEYYCLLDNRNLNFDSRLWGKVSFNNIEGILQFSF